MVRTALLSVYDKTGIVEFARELNALRWDLLASGGTARALREAGLAVRDVAELVGGGAILGHRVVTLSREVHAGLLAKDTPEDRAELSQLNIPFIDLVCVDLYPLEAEISDPASAPETVIEKTDIGGPTMLRSAAKGRRIVISEPTDRARALEWLKAGEPEPEKFLNDLAAKAELTISKYCLASGEYHSQGTYRGVLGEKKLACHYGENAWQTPAALYSTGTDDPLALDKFELVAGNAPSYNNLCDLDRMLQTITHIAAGFELNAGKAPFIAVGAKHGNSCGAAVANNPEQAVEKMLEGDPRAIFGGLVILNFEVDEKVAEKLLTHLMPSGQRRLLDGIIAPGFAEGTVEMLKRKGDKCRFLQNPALLTLGPGSLDISPRFRYVRGGFLSQPNYTFILNLQDPSVERSNDLNESQLRDLVLAWAIGSTSNSNTITLVRDGQLLGNGVGQQDRVGGAELAVKRARDAGHDTQNAVAYSDSFFPFPDGPTVLARAGVRAILASSGSVKDEEIKKSCADQGVSLVLVPDKLARGFFGH